MYQNLQQHPVVLRAIAWLYCLYICAVINCSNSPMWESKIAITWVCRCSVSLSSSNSTDTSLL